MNRLVLVYNHPERGEQRYELESGRVYSLGSKEDNDIVFPQADVSRRHAKLAVGTSSLRIIDLDSKNGTWIDGRRVRTETFSCGDPVMLSSAVFVVVEMSSGTFATAGETSQQAVPDVPRKRRDSEDTVHHRSESGEAGFVELLERLPESCAGAGPVPVLRWAVDRLGVRGALLVFLGTRGRRSVVASAGDVGSLVGGDGTLDALLSGLVQLPPPGAGGVEIAAAGSARLITVDPRHVLVLQVETAVPSNLEIRALRAALHLVLEHESRSRVQGVEEGGRIPGEGTREQSLQSAVRAFERAFIGRVLEEEGGNRTRAAERLGLSRAGLFKKMRRLGLTGSGDRGAR